MATSAETASNSFAVKPLRKESQGARKEAGSKSRDGGAGGKCNTRRQVMSDRVVQGRSSRWVHLFTKTQGGDLPLHLHAADCVSSSPPQGFLRLRDRRTVGGLV